VNQVTPALFARFPDAMHLAKAGQAELESLIRSTGFYRNKAKSLLGMARALVRFGGKCREHRRAGHRARGRPQDGQRAVGACFGQPAIVVDTHLKRVSARLGLADAPDPDRVEAQLRALVPEARQTRFTWVVGEHGRRVCAARKPRCPECPVRALCPFPDKTKE
jgi:endonuclease-3